MLFRFDTIAPNLPETTAWWGRSGDRAEELMGGRLDHKIVSSSGLKV
jgi:hypothetical protein